MNGASSSTPFLKNTSGWLFCGKQNPEESYTNKYQRYVACSYGYKLVCADYKFSKHFKTYLDKDAIYNFINIMIEKSKYWSEVIKKHFNKVLLTTKEDNEGCKNSNKCYICDNDYVDDDVKVIDHCHITGKCTGSAHIISVLN